MTTVKRKKVTVKQKDGGNTLLQRKNRVFLALIGAILGLVTIGGGAFMFRHLQHKSAVPANQPAVPVVPEEVDNESVVSDNSSDYQSVIEDRGFVDSIDARSDAYKSLPLDPETVQSLGRYVTRQYLKVPSQYLIHVLRYLSFNGYVVDNYFLDALPAYTRIVKDDVHEQARVIFDWQVQCMENGTVDQMNTAVQRYKSTHPDIVDVTCADLDADFFNQVRVLKLCLGQIKSASSFEAYERACASISNVLSERRDIITEMSQIAEAISIEGVEAALGTKFDAEEAEIVLKIKDAVDAPAINAFLATRAYSPVYMALSLAFMKALDTKSPNYLFYSSTLMTALDSIPAGDSFAEAGDHGDPMKYWHEMNRCGPTSAVEAIYKFIIGPWATPYSAALLSDQKIRVANRDLKDCQAKLSSALLGNSTDILDIFEPPATLRDGLINGLSFMISKTAANDILDMIGHRMASIDIDLSEIRNDEAFRTWVKTHARAELEWFDKTCADYFGKFGATKISVHITTHPFKAKKLVEEIVEVWEYIKTQCGLRRFDL